MKAFKFATAAAALVMGSTAFAAASIDANVELDMINRNNNAGTSAGGRVEVNVAGEAKNGDNFVRGRGTAILGAAGGSATVDDAWGQFGNSSFDVKVGRFEAADLFPTGKDNSLIDGAMYNGNKMRGRAANGQLHAAVGINASSALRIEIGILTEKNGAAGVYGIRPVVSYSAGPLSIRVGMESGKAVTAGATTTTYAVAGTVVTPTTTTAANTSASVSGFGATVGYALANGSVNLNFANGSDAWKSTAIGLNGTFGDFGAGLVLSTDKTTAKDVKTTSVYAAYTMGLMGIKGASVTPSIGMSKTDGVKDDKNEIKVRMNYAF